MPNVRSMTLADLNPVPKPSWFAKRNFITNQRVAGVALIAMSSVAAALGAVSSAGAASAASAPLFYLGSAVIGASLIQQVIGDAPGCRKAQISRLAAGACLLTMPVIGWIPASILWYHSHLENQSI